MLAVRGRNYAGFFALLYRESFSFLKRVTLVQNSTIAGNGWLTGVLEDNRVTANESLEEGGSFGNVTPPVSSWCVENFSALSNLSFLGEPPSTDARFMRPEPDAGACRLILATRVLSVHTKLWGLDARAAV